VDRRARRSRNLRRDGSRRSLRLRRHPRARARAISRARKPIRGSSVSLASGWASPPSRMRRSASVPQHGSASRLSRSRAAPLLGLAWLGLAWLRLVMQGGCRTPDAALHPLGAKPQGSNPRPYPKRRDVKCRSITVARSLPHSLQLSFYASKKFLPFSGEQTANHQYLGSVCDLPEQNLTDSLRSC
jgi:hypothetical protein